MENFDIAKYLREHQLGSYGILNHYVDIKPIKEVEVPYEREEHLTGFGEGDEFEQDETIPEGFGDEWNPANPPDVSHKFIKGGEADEDMEVLSKAIEALAKAGLTLDQIKAFASTVQNDPELLDKALAFE